MYSESARDDLKKSRRSHSARFFMGMHFFEEKIYKKHAEQKSEANHNMAEILRL
ncbi:hypothetical protein ACPR111641_16720 [Acinetobacter pragensis]